MRIRAARRVRRARRARIRAVAAARSPGNTRRGRRRRAGSPEPEGSAPIPAAGGASRISRGREPRAGRVLLGVAAGGALGSWVGSILGLAGALAWPRLAARHDARRREQHLESQMPDALRTVAAVLRSGQSLAQAIAAAAEAAPPPAGELFASAAARLAVGGRLGEAADVIVAGAPARARPLLAVALRASAIAGADLPRLLENVADALTERAATARERHAATAQARTSVAVVALAPVAFLLLSGGEAAAVLFGRPIGWALLAAGLALQAGGFLWARRVVAAP